MIKAVPLEGRFHEYFPTLDLDPINFLRGMTKALRGSPYLREKVEQGLKQRHLETKHLKIENIVNEQAVNAYASGKQLHVLHPLSGSTHYVRDGDTYFVFPYNLDPKICAQILVAGLEQMAMQPNLYERHSQSQVDPRFQQEPFVLSALDFLVKTSPTGADRRLQKRERILATTHFLDSYLCFRDKLRAGEDPDPYTAFALLLAYSSALHRVLSLSQDPDYSLKLKERGLVEFLPSEMTPAEVNPTRNIIMSKMGPQFIYVENWRNKRLESKWKTIRGIKPIKPLVEEAELPKA